MFLLRIYLTLYGIIGFLLLFYLGVIYCTIVLLGKRFNSFLQVLISLAPLPFSGAMHVVELNLFRSFLCSNRLITKLKGGNLCELCDVR